MAPHDDLADFQRGSFTWQGATRTVFRRGEGPGVVVMHEMPGITPAVAGFGRRVADAGFTAVLPCLFGEPGKPMSPTYGARQLAWGCVSREFTTWATGRTSPIVAWCRALARQVHAECGGPGVGALGMCFTGGFALAMMVDDGVVAPVLSQPSLPFAVGPGRSADLGLSPADEARVRERAEAGCDVLGLRFTHDRFVPAARFASLRRLLGERFLSVEIDSSPGNPWGLSGASHSVLTEHLVDEPGHPTAEALHQVLEFFRERLEPTAG
ncbi:MAG: dienelactone hydrolase family protein [Acidimicrobiales bacterium]|nr:dienelactone hydrolase family protein [Acidimicrobiales bacterium]